MNLPQLREDYANHYLYGSAAAVVGAHLAPLFGLPRSAGALIGSTAAGIAKEAIDWVLNRIAVHRGKAKPHTVDPLDILATAAGGIPVALALEGI